MKKALNVMLVLCLICCGFMLSACGGSQPGKLNFNYESNRTKMDSNAELDLYCDAEIFLNVKNDTKDTVTIVKDKFTLSFIAPHWVSYGLYNVNFMDVVYVDQSIIMKDSMGTEISSYIDLESGKQISVLLKFTDDKLIYDSFYTVNSPHIEEMYRTKFELRYGEKVIWEGLLNKI